MSVSAAQLYAEHRQRVFRLCLRLSGGDVSWSEDATQDVFLKLLQTLPDLDRQQELGGWVYRVTVNTCLTRLRRDRSAWRRVLESLALIPQAQPQTPERAVALRGELQAALTALAQLPPRERVVFSMRHLDELPQREIAATLALSEGYVSKLLDRARGRLQREGWEVSDAAV